MPGKELNCEEMLSAYACFQILHMKTNFFNFLTEFTASNKTEL